MKREEFFTKLKRKLKVLDQTEVDDIVQEYEGYIEDKIKNGKTEEEAIEDFGDLDELAKELLRAYKINVDKKDTMGTIQDNVDKGVDYIEGFVERVTKRIDGSNGNRKIDPIQVVFEVIFILIALSLVRIPIKILYKIFASFMFGGAIGFAFEFVFGLIVGVFYLLLVVFVFYRYFQTRFPNDVSSRGERKSNNKEDDKDSDEEKSPKKKVEKNTFSEERKERVVRNQNMNVDNTVEKVLITICKVFVVFFLIGAFAVLIAQGIGTGFIIYLFTKHITYVGLFLMLLSSLIFNGMLISSAIRFLSNRKQSAFSIISSIVLSIILFVVGIIFFMDEVINTNLVREPIGIVGNTVIQEIDSNKNLRLQGNVSNVEYIIDEEYDEKIKVEVTYFHESTNYNPISVSKNRIVISNFTSSRSFLELFYESLRNREFEVYKYRPIIKITGNAKAINDLKTRVSYSHHIDW